MQRIRSLILLISMAIVLPVDADKPNVILVMSDDQGWTQTGYYGHPIASTPNLDDMANSGLRMDRFYSGAPFCVPTRATVLTGRTNTRTGVLPNVYMDKREKMLATAFKEAGYATGHFGKWHLSGEEDPDNPIPASNPHHPGEHGFDYWLSKSTQFNLEPLLSRNGVTEQFEGDGSEVIVDEALQFIERETKKKPVFVIVWYSTPHRDFEASEEDVAPFLGRTDESSALQLGELAAMDRSIGTLRQGLKDLGIAKNTLVWFTSDNGGLPDVSHGARFPPVLPDSTGHLRGFKKDLYEGGIRVPAIVEWPGKIKHRVSHYPSGTIDMFLTLIDIAGLDPNSINPVNDGVSLAPVFNNQEPPRREKPMGFRVNAGQAWLDNDWKLVRNYNQTEDAPFELYNVVGDPSESNNLIDQRQDIAQRMMKELNAWNASIERSVSGADYPK
ncbi:MAG: N-acetylgalactosamine 6-sulfate sulfatase [Gammaproteobacteria bacterium]|nr:N-acetylgalactosamine 6-sulfate sulfatase [Gammaproteobacteria bacterium]